MRHDQPGWRREAISLGLGLMELLWLRPWLGFALDVVAGSGTFSFAAISIALLTAYYCTRVMDALVIPLAGQRLVTVVLALGSTSVLVRLFAYSDLSASDPAWWRVFLWDLASLMHRVPRGLIVAAGGLLVSWRGVELAQRDVRADSVGGSFRVGIIALLWFLFLSMFSPRFDATPYVQAYFTVGLAVVALARVNEVGASSLGIRSPFSLSWLAIVTGAVATAIGAGWSLVRLLSPSSLGLLIELLDPLWHAIALLARPLLWVLEGLFAIVFRLLVRLFSYAFAARGAEEGLALPSTLEQLASGLARITPSPRLWVLHALQWLVLGAGALLVILGLALAVRRRDQPSEDARPAEHDTLEWAMRNAGDLRLSPPWLRLRETLQDWMVRVRGQPYALETIKQIYASLVRLAALSGTRRRATDTPYEFLDALHRTFPGCEAEVGTITEAYVRAHYGMWSPAVAHVREVRLAWLAVRAGQTRGSSTVQ